LEQAAKQARFFNPINAPNMGNFPSRLSHLITDREFIAVVTQKYWHTNGMLFTVGFLDSPAADLRARILSHMNAWSKAANVKFVESNVTPTVRIARTSGEQGGYWSYVGTDILQIDKDQPTMNLEGFTMETPDSEFHRVVRHETGHTLGCPHEHMRREFVSRIDRDKAIPYYFRLCGWDETTVEQQVLTPIEESSLIGTQHDDGASIMCYQIPGEITKDGQPIVGGSDIDPQDYAFMGKIYPKAGAEVSDSVPGEASTLSDLPAVLNTASSTRASSIFDFELPNGVRVRLGSTMDDASIRRALAIAAQS